MKVWKIIKNAVVFLLLIAGLVFSIFRLSEVMRDKENPAVQDSFAALEPDSVDVVFIGTSHQFCSINPDLLAEEYDINCFMLATSAQTVPMSYYAAMEAIELQHPDTIVFEVAYCANDFRTVSPGMSHAFFDGMPNCEAKKLAINDLEEEEGRIYYYINFGLYHNRWKDLTEEDFQGIRLPSRGGYYSDNVKYNWAIPVVDRSDKQDMPEEMQKYMDMLVELCRENNVNLIFYAAPFNALYDDDAMREDLYQRQRIFNSVDDYARKNGIPYYNLFYELDSIGLDPATDWMDTQHLNNVGQAKLTRYMADRGYFFPQ